MEDRRGPYPPVYMRDSTPVPPLAMMLLAGGELVREPGGGTDGSMTYATGGDGYDDILALDGFYRLHVPANAAGLVVELRDRIQALVRRLVNTSGAGGSGGASGRGRNNSHNNAGPAPPTTGDKEGETIVRDMVEALTHISKWQDVRLVPEVSAHDRKKMENQRKNTAKVAAQREAKAKRQGGGRGGGGRGGGGSWGGRGGGGGGGRGGGGRGGGGGGGGRGNWAQRGGPIAGQSNWANMNGGGGGGRPSGGSGGAPDAKRHRKF